MFVYELKEESIEDSIVFVTKYITSIFSQLMRPLIELVKLNFKELKFVSYIDSVTESVQRSKARKNVDCV